MNASDTEGGIREPREFEYDDLYDTEPALMVGDVVHNVDQDTLKTLSRYQMREKLDSQAITRYSKQVIFGSKMPPIGVAWFGDEFFVVVDGFHRHAALLSLGDLEKSYRPSIEIVAITDEEARDYARLANIDHGVPLKTRDIKNILRSFMEDERYIKEVDEDDCPDECYSLREIASEVLKGRVHYTTVRNWLVREFPEEYSWMTYCNVRDAIEEPDTGGLTQTELKVDRLVMQGLDLLEQLKAYVPHLRESESAIRVIRELADYFEGVEIRNPYDRIEEEDSPF